MRLHEDAMGVGESGRAAATASGEGVEGEGEEGEEGVGSRLEKKNGVVEPVTSEAAADETLKITGSLEHGEGKEKAGNVTAASLGREEYSQDA